MSRQIQIRRGTAAEHSNFTGAIGEITMDTTSNTLRVHDGVTPGGNETMPMKKFYSNLTNCITEIPQDIKLELDNGILTLKSGSKVYNGNGLIATTANDITFSWSGTATGIVIVLLADGSALNAGYMGNSVSSLPAATTSNKVYYNTTDKKCYLDVGSWVETSFPLAFVSANEQISLINEVFNGFGYVGNVVFALPGVKGLIPSGRNVDGSLKSTEYTLTSVTTIDVSSIGLGYKTIILKNDGTLECCTSVSVNHNNYLLCNGSCLKQAFVVAGCGRNSSEINVFNKREVFHAVDYTDASFNVCKSTPSKKYINLTLGSSGTMYTAPADGWILIDGEATNASYGYILLGGSTCNVSSTVCSNPAVVYMATTIPVSKGMSFGVWYGYFSVGRFRFVYANGVL